MRSNRQLATRSGDADIEGALGVMAAEDLRELVRDLLLDLAGEPHDRIVDRILERAARKGADWSHQGPSNAEVAEIVAFAEAAKREGCADAGDVDRLLRQGTSAFLAKDYAGAQQVFRAILPPIDKDELYLGQHESVDEVLGVDVELCATRFVVSVYMTSNAKQRAKAVHDAIYQAGDLGLFLDPLREMERVAVEPLPGLDEFLPRWRAVVEKSAGGGPRCGWDTGEDRWLREVVKRLEGTEGLARIARSTRRGKDLRAWCGTLVEKREWESALPAFEEAAEIVVDRECWCGEFLDGTALAAQELGRKDLPKRLEVAWRAAPSLQRLQRWLGSARSKARVRELATRALDACPKRAENQRAPLHLILGDFESATKRLTVSPGLGWSHPDHPGHLLFYLFDLLLKDREEGASATEEAIVAHGQALGVPASIGGGLGEPTLRMAELEDILDMAGVRGPIKGKDRRVVLDAMRTAAGKRLDGVTKKKRRRYYDHAAVLVAACAQHDSIPACRSWIEGLRAKYSRYSALQREFDRFLEKE